MIDKDDPRKTQQEMAWAENILRQMAGRKGTLTSVRAERRGKAIASLKATLRSPDKVALAEVTIRSDGTWQVKG